MWPEITVLLVSAFTPTPSPSVARAVAWHGFSRVAAGRPVMQFDDYDGSDDDYDDALERYRALGLFDDAAKKSGSLMDDDDDDDDMTTEQMVALSQSVLDKAKQNAANRTKSR